MRSRLLTRFTTRLSRRSAAGMAIAVRARSRRGLADLGQRRAQETRGEVATAIEPARRVRRPSRSPAGPGGDPGAAGAPEARALPALLHRSRLLVYRRRAR